MMAYTFWSHDDANQDKRITGLTFIDDDGEL
jgi:hypothetical protein